MLALVAASPVAQGQSSEEGTAAGHLRQSSQTGGWSTDKKYWLQSWLVNFRAWPESLKGSVGLKESAMGQDTESQCGSCRTSVYTRRKPAPIAKAGTQYWSGAMWWAQEGSSTVCCSLFVSLGVGEAPVINIQSPLQKDEGGRAWHRDVPLTWKG